MQVPTALQCSDYGTYAIKIYNNTEDLAVFPVLATPTNDADEWLQAAFHVPKAKISQLTYAHKFQYRMYVKPRVGIAPGEHVILTLPLYSQLAGAPDGTKPDEYIDWWNGGRIHIYGSPVAVGAPAALTRNFDLDQPNIVSPLTPGPACAGCPMPNPPIYRSPTALPVNGSAQLTEYTVGAIDKGEIYTIVADLKIVDLGPTGPIGNGDIDHNRALNSLPDIRVVIG